jgi:signal-transduction protein with cAMP-binding, CBS, and nucleotidyltransferase domain
MVSGSALIQKNNSTLAKISRGDIIGYMALLGVSKSERHYFDIVTCEEGLIAVMIFSEIKDMLKKQTKEVFTLYNFISYHCYEQLHFQKNNETLTYTPSVPYTIIPPKAMEKDFKEHKKLSEFIRKMSPKELPLLFESLKYSEVELSKLIIKEKYHKRSLYILTNGTVEMLSGEGENSMILTAPQIIGLNNFMFDHEWKMSIYAKTRCRIYELQYESFNTLKEKNIELACEILKGIIKFKENETVGKETKLSNAKAIESVIPDADPNRIYEVPFSKLCTKADKKSEETRNQINVHKYQQFASTMPVISNAPIPNVASPRVNQKCSGFIKDKLRDQQAKLKSSKKGKKESIAKQMAQTMPILKSNVVEDQEESKSVDEAELREAELLKRLDHFT